MAMPLIAVTGEQRLVALAEPLNPTLMKLIGAKPKPTVRDPTGKPVDYPPLLHHPPIHPVIGERTAIVRGRRREIVRERELAAVMSAIMSAIAVIERMSAKDYTAAV